MTQRKVGRPKKDGKYINCYCDANLVERLSACAVQKGVSKTVLIEQALRQYLNDFENMSTKG